MFLNLIKNEINNRLEVIKKVKTQNKKLMLYGAGVRAQMLTDFLREYSIEVSGYIVDDQYYKEGMKLFDKKIYRFSDVCENLGECIVLIAFQNYERASSIIKNAVNTEIYYIDDPYDFYKMDYDYILKNDRLFAESYNMMSDELSKQIFIAFINGKISDSPEELCSLRNTDGYQYDYRLLGLGDNEVIVDCGAYTGDTIKDILSYTGGKYNKIFAFEPDSKNCEEMRCNIPEKNIKIINKGVWHSSDVLKFHSSKSTASSFNEYSDGVMSDYINEEDLIVPVPVTSIDEELSGEDVTLIKMDIEGSELSALMGAEKIIKRCFPKLAICVYHRVDDFITIPQYIRSLSSDKIKYKFYMRHHAAWMAETVLYAIPESVSGDINE